MFAAAGYQDDLNAFDAADGDRPAAAIGEEFIAALCAIGDDADVRSTIDRYRQAGATNPILTGIRGTDFAASLRAAVAQDRITSEA